MFKDLLAKRDSILDVFRKASADLEAVNNEITEAMDANMKVIVEKTQENSNMSNLKAQNINSIRSLKKILGDKS